jgi:adenylate kinase
MLEERMGVRVLSSGLIFRQEIEAETDLGRLATRYIDQGRLVPDDVTIEMMAKRIRLADVLRRGFLLDGFPRNVDQAEALTQMLQGIEAPIDRVLALFVDDEIVVQRLSGRIGCTKCGAIYHSTNRPPKRENLCDLCNSPLFVRSDDTPEAIRERLRVYHENTAPVISYYDERGALSRIDGSQEPEQVFKQIVAAARGATAA